MLLVFDLDDTLIDTSGTVVPVLLKDAFDHMLKRGLTVSEAGFDELKALDAASENSQDAIFEYIELHGGTKDDADAAFRRICDVDAFSFPIETFEGAIPLLEELSREHTLVLATRGIPAIQEKKLELSGINPDLFEYIHITERGEKKPIYQKILSETGVTPEQTFTIGDRIKKDLTPAKELGMNTIHVKRGRGLGYTGVKKDVDYTIIHLNQIKPILEGI